MQKCYLDSNFLVYIKNENSPYFQRASSLVLELASKEVDSFATFDSDFKKVFEDKLIIPSIGKN